MTQEELDKQIDKWLKRLETMKPFIDRKVRLNIRREELLQDMKLRIVPMEAYDGCIPVTVWMVQKRVEAASSANG